MFAKFIPPFAFFAVKYCPAILNYTSFPLKIQETIYGDFYNMWSFFQKAFHPKASQDQLHLTAKTKFFVFITKQTLDFMAFSATIIFEYKSL